MQDHSGIRPETICPAAPGSRPGQPRLATLSAVLPTLVREALTRRAARRVGIRRDWRVMEPSPVQPRETLEARRALECGMPVVAMPPGPTGIARLRPHLSMAERSMRPGNFHVHVAEILGNRIAAPVLRDHLRHAAVILAARCPAILPGATARRMSLPPQE